MKKILLIALTMLVLVGCSSNKTETTTYAYEEDGFYDEITLTYINDEIIRDVQVMKASYEYLELENAEEAEVVFSTYGDWYNEIDGITCTKEFTNSEIIITININVKKTSIENLKAIEYISSDFDPDKDYISHQITSKSYITNGYSIVEK